jgi:hypothetical protein
MPLGLQEVKAPRISRQAHEGGRVVSPAHQLPLPPPPPGHVPDIQFCYMLSRPHGHSAAGRSQ